MSKGAFRISGLRVDWTCPRCFHTNQTSYTKLTPVCDDCEDDIEWEELLTEEQRTKLERALGF